MLGLVLGYLPLPQSGTDLYQSLKLVHETESLFVSPSHWDPVSCSRHQFSFLCDGGQMLISPKEIKDSLAGWRIDDTWLSIRFKMDHTLGWLEFCRRDENIWYSNDVSNITTDRGWSLSWDMNKFKIEANRYSPLHPVVAASHDQTLPPVGIRFHRRISICKISFDVAAQLTPHIRSPTPKITIYIGQKNKNIVWDTQSPSDQRNGVFHYEFFVRDYGVTVPTLYILGNGFYFGNRSMRRITYSNLVIREKFDHHIHNDWFAEYNEGAEERLSSTALKASLAEELPAELEFPHLADDRRCPQISDVNLNRFEGLDRVRQLREGVNVIVESRLPHQDTSYLYRYSDYPSRILGFVSSLDYPMLRIQLPNATRGNHYWYVYITR